MRNDVFVVLFRKEVFLFLDCCVFRKYYYESANTTIKLPTRSSFFRCASIFFLIGIASLNIKN